MRNRLVDTYHPLLHLYSSSNHRNWLINMPQHTSEKWWETFALKFFYHWSDIKCFVFIVYQLYATRCPISLFNLVLALTLRNLCRSGKLDKYIRYYCNSSLEYGADECLRWWNMNSSYLLFTNDLSSCDWWMPYYYYISRINSVYYWTRGEVKDIAKIIFCWMFSLESCNFQYIHLPRIILVMACFTISVIEWYDSIFETHFRFLVIVSVSCCLRFHSFIYFFQHSH